MKSNTKRLLKHLESGKKITSRQADNKWGMTRLAARILDLKEMNKKIESRFVTVKNRFNEKVSVKVYWMEV